MRRRRQFKKGCEPVKDHCGITGKARWASEGAAAQALEEVQRMRTRRGAHRAREQRFYHCVFCDGFHLTSRAA